MRRLLLVALASCGDSSPGESPSYEGSHVVLFSEPELGLCAGSLAAMDGFVPLNHELVHSVALPFGLPRPLFAEGLAVAYEGLGDGPLSAYGLLDDTNVLELAEADQREFVDLAGYRLAGAFTHFLVQRHGISQYMQAYGAIGRDATTDDIDEVFRDMFGVSLEQSVADFESLPPLEGSACSHPAFDAKLLECDAPQLAWDGGHLSMERTLACEASGVIGPFDDKLLALHTIEIATQGRYELRLHGDAAQASPYPDLGVGDNAVTGVSLRRCGGCDEGDWMATWVGGTPRLAELRPGLYSLRLHGVATDAVTLGFTLSLLPNDAPMPTP
ncbi:hypothetical protein [Nannocystis pusilla]|uniref:hypothetical protein n=1 Tax=Nannocystis pusilla TaxID=889268 RepID=UPI003BF3AB80